MKNNTGLLSGQTILVVDDDKDLRLLYKEMLENQAAKVLLADNGLTGLELFTEKNTQIDLVLLDLMMPLMTGDICLAKMQKIAPKLKAIVLSGYADDAIFANIQSCLNNNIILCQKPLKFKVLFEKMVQLLEERRQ